MFVVTSALLRCGVQMLRGLRALRRAGAARVLQRRAAPARWTLVSTRAAAPATTRCVAAPHAQAPAHARAFSTPANNMHEAYQQVYTHWSRLNADGLHALKSNELDKAEARFIAAANVCATFTQTVATASLYSGVLGAGADAGVVNAGAGVNAPPALHRALSLHNLGVVYVKLKKADSAKKVFREAIAILRVYTLSDYQVVGNVYRELAALYEAENNWAEATENYHHAFQYFDRSHHPHAPQQAALSLYSMGLVAHKRRTDGSLDEAEKHYRAALELATLAYGRKHKNVGQVMYSLGHLLVDKHQFGKAKDYYMNAAEVLQEAGDSTFLRAMADYMELVSRMGEDEADARAAAAPAAAAGGKKAAPGAAADAAAGGAADPVRARASREVKRIEQLKPQQRKAAYAKLAKELKMDEWEKDYVDHNRKTKADAERDERERQIALAAHLQARRAANEAQGQPAAAAAAPTNA